MINILTLGKIAFRNLFRYLAHNSMTGLILITANVLFFTTSSLSKNSEAGWRNFYSATFLGDYMISAYEPTEKDYSRPNFQFPENVITGEVSKQLDKRGVTYTNRVKLGAAVYNYRTYEFEGDRLITLIGADIQKELSLLSNIILTEGKYDPKLDNGVLVWKELADDYNWKVNDEINLFLKDIDNNAYPFTFKIAGFITRKKDQHINMPKYPIMFVSFDYLQKLTGLNEYDSLEISIWDHEKKYAGELENLAKEHNLNFYFGEQGFNVTLGYMGLINFVGYALNLFLLLLLIVSTINFNVMSLYERQKEFATMIAIGYNPLNLSMLLILEGLFFMLICFCISLLAYFLIIHLFSEGIDFGALNALFGGSFFMPSIDIGVVLISFTIVSTVILLTYVYPISLIAKMNPAAVFREGKI